MSLSWFLPRSWFSDLDLWARACPWLLGGLSGSCSVRLAGSGRADGEGEGEGGWPPGPATIAGGGYGRRGRGVWCSYGPHLKKRVSGQCARQVDGSISGTEFNNHHGRFLYNREEPFVNGYELGIVKYFDMPASWNRRMQRGEATKPSQSPYPTFHIGVCKSRREAEDGGPAHRTWPPCPYPANARMLRQ